MTRTPGPGKGKQRVMSRLLARFRLAALGLRPGTNKKRQPSKPRRPRRRPRPRRRSQPGWRRKCDLSY